MDREDKRRGRGGRRLLLISAGFVLVALLVSTGALFVGARAGWLSEWTGDHHFGKIREVRAGGLTIVNGKGREQSVVVDEHTRVRKGGAVLNENDLPKGSNVIIVGPSNTNGEVQARVIRLFGSE